MVPLLSASAKSRVTPPRVTNREPGKPARTASGPRPPYAPTAQASGIATTPTFSFEAKLMTMAARRARSDATAGDIDEAFYPRRVRPVAGNLYTLFLVDIV